MGVENLEGNDLAGFRVVRLIHTTLTAGCDAFEDTVSANTSLLTHGESLNAIVATSISDGDGDDWVVSCAGNSIQFALHSTVIVHFTLRSST